MIDRQRLFPLCLANKEPPGGLTWMNTDRSLFLKSVFTRAHPW